MMIMNGRNEIQMEGKNLIFPIMEYEKIAFFISVDRMSLNIFNFVDQVFSSKKINELFTYFHLNSIKKVLKIMELYLSYLKNPKRKTIILITS